MSRHHQRLPRHRWRRIRRAVLDSANWRCASCSRFGNEVDHIIPLHRGGAPWARDNLQALCGGPRGCHAMKTARENRRVLSPEQQAWRELLEDLARG